MDEIILIEKLKELINAIYGFRLINYELKDGVFSINKEKGLIDHIKINETYKNKIIELFRYTFCNEKDVGFKYWESNSKLITSRIGFIVRFCKFVGIEDVEVLQKGCNYAYRYTEDSPFKVMESFYKYAPNGEIVVCCNSSQIPEQNKIKKVSIEEFLNGSELYIGELGKQIFSLLEDDFIPFLFNCPLLFEYDYKRTNENFEEIRHNSKKWLLRFLNCGDFPGSEPVSYECTIIILDSEYDIKHNDCSFFDLKDDNTDYCKINHNDESFLSSVPVVLWDYGDKKYLPKIKETGMYIQNKYDCNLFYISDKEIQYDVKETIYERYESEFTSHYKQYMRYIEKLLEIIFSFDISAMMQDDMDSDSVFKYFVQLDNYNPKNFSYKDSKLFGEMADETKNIKKSDELFEGGTYLPKRDKQLMINTAKKKMQLEFQPPQIAKIEFPELSFTDSVFEWIGNVSDKIRTIALVCSWYYNRFIPNSVLQNHCDIIRKYANSEKLKMAITEMDKENNATHWKKVRFSYEPVFKELKEALEKYLDCIENNKHMGFFNYNPFRIIRASEKKSVKNQLTVIK